MPTNRHYISPFLTSLAPIESWDPGLSTGAKLIKNEAILGLVMGMFRSTFSPSVIVLDPVVLHSELLTIWGRWKLEIWGFETAWWKRDFERLKTEHYRTTSNYGIFWIEVNYNSKTWIILNRFSKWFKLPSPVFQFCKAMNYNNELWLPVAI